MRSIRDLIAHIIGARASDDPFFFAAVGWAEVCPNDVASYTVFRLVERHPFQDQLDRIAKPQCIGPFGLGPPQSSCSWFPLVPSPFIRNGGSSLASMTRAFPPGYSVRFLGR